MIDGKLDGETAQSQLERIALQQSPPSSSQKDLDDARTDLEELFASERKDAAAAAGEDGRKLADRRAQIVQLLDAIDLRLGEPVSLVESYDKFLISSIFRDLTAVFHSQLSEQRCPST
jgi:hypothetical protein